MGEAMQGLLQKSVGWATQITVFCPGLKRGVFGVLGHQNIAEETGTLKAFFYLEPRQK